MAATPTTQSVPTPTPVLSIELIRQTLNPAPAPGSPYDEIRDYGYLDAMLDQLFENIYDESEEINPRLWIHHANRALNYEGCFWFRVEWDYYGLMTIHQLIKTIDQQG